MYSRNSGYQNLEDLYHERDSVAVSKRQSAFQSAFPGNGTTDTEPQWYWRLIATASTWMILGGYVSATLNLSLVKSLKTNCSFCSYLILPSTFETDPQLRFSKGVLSIIIVALLTGGYALTVLLYIACPSVLFRLESIFIPTASVSAFSFFAILYALASSNRYTFSLAPCPVSLALSATSATLYGALAYFTDRRILGLKGKTDRIREWRRHTRAASTPTITQSNNLCYSSGGYNDPVAGTSSAATATNQGSYMEPNYYANFIANMHPTARKYHRSNYPPGVSDDEMVAQQMAALLKKKDSDPSPDASSSTFRLDWNFNEEDDIDPLTGAKRKPTFDMNSPAGRRAVQEARGQRSGRSTPLLKITKALGISGAERGRSENRGEEGARAKSREERRREIEMANLGA